MKYFIFFACGLLLAAGINAQSKITKPVIDADAIRNWESIENDHASITNDGNYFMYGVTKGGFDNPSRLILQSTKGDWKKELPGINEGFFSGDSKQFIYQSGDTLFFLKPGTDEKKTILHVGSVQRPTGDAGFPYTKGEWIAWQINDESKTVMLHNLLTGKDQSFDDVTGYSFDIAGHVLVLKSETRGNRGMIVALKLVKLSNGKMEKIWSREVSSDPGPVISEYHTDTAGEQVMFMVQEKQGEEVNSSIWYYKAGMEKAVEKVNNRTAGIDPGLTIDNEYMGFSLNGKHMFFSLRGPTPAAAPKEAESLDVWSYHDMLLQSVQLHRLEPEKYRSVIGVESNRVIELTKEYERIEYSQPTGDYTIIRHDESGDKFWLKKQNSKCELVSLKDGSRRTLKSDGYSNYCFSPNGLMLIYFQNDNYYRYDLKNGLEIKISASVPNGWLSHHLNSYGGFHLKVPNGIAGWLDQGKGVMVYDEYDIWLLDLAGEKAAINLTNSYGRRHKIKLRLPDNQEALKKGISNELPILLVAFNVVTKYNGFYMLNMRKVGNPVLLTMGAVTMDHEGSGEFVGSSCDGCYGGLEPLKAANADIWIVSRSTPVEAPNYFLTSDFRFYQRLTNIQPQLNYNWYTKELVRFPQLDGSIGQGVLFKPEDFSPFNKYPLIIQYYEQMSNTVYEYGNPDFTKGPIDIPWYVSHGYLVFTPDIQYKYLADMGHSVVNTVEGAGRYFAKRTYIDGKRIGVNGHSHGGAETNCLITHSHFFAAALSGAAGHSGVDLISNSLKVYINDGNNGLNRYEMDDIGSTLWQRPDLWIKNSPIFQVNNITTPVLIFYSKADLEWERAVEFFIALRRLNKKTWLLQYDNGSHVLWGKDCEDYTIRVQQFFDHYLKGSPPPKWMTVGIPAKLKGIDSGLE